LRRVAGTATVTLVARFADGAMTPGNVREFAVNGDGKLTLGAPLVRGGMVTGRVVHTRTAEPVAGLSLPRYGTGRAPRSRR
jgi:hypothetical protein